MQTQFSPTLIAKCQKIFRRKLNKKISAEKAELVLDQLSKLGMLAIKTFSESNNLISDKNNHEKNNPPR